MNLVEYVKNWNALNYVDLVLFVVISLLVGAFFVHKRSFKVFVLFMVLCAAYCVASLFNAKSAGNSLIFTVKMLKLLILFSVFCMAIVYQQDVKIFFQSIANANGKTLFSEGYGSDDELMEAADELITAVQNMAKQDIGALIIITPGTVDQHILDSGTMINATLTAPLIETLFHDKTPLHDGAVVIKGNKIISAGCFLPLTQDTTLPKELGTRHRAAIGITEESGVLAIVVSEETGIISIAKQGKLTRYMTTEKLKEEIKNCYGVGVAPTKKKKFRFRKK